MKSSLSTVAAKAVKFGSVAALAGSLSACVIAPHHGYGRVDQSGPVVVQAAPVVVAPAPPVVVVRPAVRYGWYGHRYYR
jgi:hypothetical protein